MHDDTIPCLYAWTLVENNMSYAVRNDVSGCDLHCTPDGAGTGRRKERWKEGSKNGNPPIYVMRIIAASVSCSGGKVREGGRSRDWKIIRVVIDVVATFSREARVPSHLLSPSVSNSVRNAVCTNFWFAGIERKRPWPLPSRTRRQLENFRCGSRVSQSVTNFDELPPI